MMDRNRIEPKWTKSRQLSRIMLILLLVICTEGRGQETNSCIPSGDHTSIQNALTEVGSKAILCPNAVFELSEEVYFTADSQSIYTEGFPTDSSRAFLQIAHQDLATAVAAGNNSHVTLSHVIIDGARPEFGAAQGALLEWGSTGMGNKVEWVKAYEPRGWSILYLGEGDDRRCSGAEARYNELGPGGRAEYGYADGISLACPNSIVENNTIFDVTDGGIVIFQAPGSIVANNTIRAENRIMFYGISMEDHGPWDGDFTGTQVTGNTVDAAGAMIRRGIAMGPYIGCIPSEETTLKSRGAVVANNTLMGNHMAYGFVVSGVEDWTVTGNVDLSTHLVPEREADCFGDVVDTPAGFQFNPAISSGTFQAEFEEAVLGFTMNMWTFQPVVSESCLAELIGAELLEDIKAGNRGPLWLALETAPNGERIDQCISLYQPPDISDLSGYVQVSLSPCEPFCVEVELFNISETDTVDMRRAQFLLEDFPVECVDIPESLNPREVVSCTISDFVTPGFQVLRWYGFPPGPGDWGFEYLVEPSGVTTGEKQSQQAKGFLFSQNYPNPFNGSTIINYIVPKGANMQVDIKMYDLLGRLIRTLVEAERPPGRYNVRWDGKDEQGKEVSSGLYFCRIKAGSFRASRKMMFLR